MRFKGVVFKVSPVMPLFYLQLWLSQGMLYTAPHLEFWGSTSIITMAGYGILYLRLFEHGLHIHLVQRLWFEYHNSENNQQRITHFNVKRPILKYLFISVCEVT